MAAGTAAQAQPQIEDRITGAVRSDATQRLQGTVHPLVAVSADQGALSGETAIQDMALVFRRSAAQEADLQSLLAAQQTSGSSEYHQWLKPGEFAARYGVSQQDLAKAAAWLRSEGFHIDDIPASADRIVFSGTAAQVNAAFHTEMHRYAWQGETHRANATEIELPQALAGMAIGIQHLNTFRPRPHAVRREVAVRAVPGSSAVRPQYTLQSQNTEYNFLAPADIATIYDLNGLYYNNITGSGQTLAVAGETDITQYENDVKSFRQLSGLNAANLPTQVVAANTGTVTVSPGDLPEADIDIEWSGAVAKDATILFVTSGTNGNVFDALQYAIQTPLLNSGTKFVPVISISYGICEQQGGVSGIQQLEQVLEQANAQGQTVVAAAGDDGSATCDYGVGSPGAQNGLTVDYPASSQYVTGVGGTSFNGDVGNTAYYWNASNGSGYESARLYIPETAWNNTPNEADLQSFGTLSAGGGGASSLFTKPSWQTGPGVPADGKRDVPDISLASDPAHDGYVLCTEETNSAGTAFTTNPPTTTCAYPLSSGEVAYFPASGSGYVYGGTSIAAPQIAAMITLWNQKAGNTNGVGNVNPFLYLNASTQGSAFHDVTTGSNAVVCKAGSPDCVSSSGGYVLSCCSAGTGYDMATGLGSVEAAAMGAIWPQLPAVNASFSLLLNSPTISVAPGNSASTKIILSPSGVGGDSVAGFSGTVALGCSNLPAGVTCSFTNAQGAAITSIQLSPGVQQTVTLTVSATSSAAATTTAQATPAAPLRRWPMETAFAGVFGLSLLGLGRRRAGFGSRWLAMMVVACGLMGAAVLTACSGGSVAGGSGTTGTTGSTGGSGGSTPISQTVTVTGTSGSTTASAQLQLIVT